MPVLSISKEGFDAYNPMRAPGAEMIVEEREWFADSKGTLLGVIALDRADQDWFIGALGRDDRGQFRAIDVDSCIENLDDARNQLLAKMEKIRASGKRIFPQ